jgi:hypothetical protein
MHIEFRCGQSLERRPFGRQRKPAENMKLGFQETGCKDVNLTVLTQKQIQWQGLQLLCFGVLLPKSWLLFTGNDNKDDCDSNKNIFCYKMLQQFNRVSDHTDGKYMHRIFTCICHEISSESL